ncbi:hypothetical protein GCM10010965_13580 [Caldalkalibacillus thermarum]|uniref:YhcN/YlaJ family sporulation lipoprotein n=1 Tax=Caldalkalibacillus thermarum TaxID=296745 RepID=UPI001664D81F|nr:YhcN/YlaJ family sporulation lipoprotein [Caldalkalibacillus thermarum]GGK21890.1 hypothetical protein GCM10010965_13580 [Caldalkalibacillus thermarum]
MHKRGLAVVLAVFLSISLAACRDVDETAPYDTKYFMAQDPDAALHKGGAHEGPQGRQYRSLYGDGGGRREAQNFGNRFFRFDRDSGLRDHLLDDDGPLGSRRLQEERPGFAQPLGFREYSADDPEASYRGFGAQTYIDRQILADTIAQVVVGLPDINTATVLVTDEECLIGYTADRKGPEIHQQVEMSGLSVAPRWYKVYATDDTRLTNHIRQIANEYTRNYDPENLNNEVNTLVEQLGGPQTAPEQERRMKENNQTRRSPQEMDRKETTERNQRFGNLNRKGNINQ